MERQDYPAMLASLQPNQAVEVLDDRVRQVGKLNSAIADWLQERRRIEEQYAAGLRKLGLKNLSGVDLGVFSTPWSALTNAAETAADSHHALAQKIETDVERPLRDFVTSNREMKAMSTIQGNLAALAREVENAQKKTEKLKDKGDRAETGKVANANTDLENAQGQWESQAPYVFENLQAVDETRLNHLRDVLTQFQTHEVDIVEKSRVSAEQGLNVLLNMQTEDEIKTFALRTVQGKDKITRQRSNVASPAAASFASPSTPTISRPDDSASQRSGSLSQEPKKGGMKGLKRLGTVLGRRRESKQPQNLGTMEESPERKSRVGGSAFNSFSSRMGRSRDTPTLEPPQDSRRERPRSPLRMGSEVLESPRSKPQPPAPRQLRDEGVNGTSSNTGATTAVAAGFAGVAGVAGAGALSIPNGSHQADLTDIEPPKASEPDPDAIQPVQEAQRDAEGFSMPPQNLDPISQAQQEAAAANESERAFNVNIRNAPIQEEGQDADAALANMATKLQMQAPAPMSRRLGTVRGRREARNSTFTPPPEQISETAPLDTTSAPAVAERAVSPPQQLSPTSPFPIPGPVAASTFSPFSPTGPQDSPFRPGSQAAQRSVDPQGTETESIRSGRSLTSTGSQGMKHAELHGTGLSSSVVETVSASFEDGRATRSTLIGEIALAYNPADFSTPFGSENIRLESFPSLEKVAPNPAFISHVDGKVGEYTVSLSNITKTQVAFKYQVRLEDASSLAPILIKPSYKIEPTRASVIVSYSMNPTFALHGRSSITLSGVALALTLDGAKASSCQSKPAGTFVREKNQIIWQLGDVVLTPGMAETKLLARFMTETEGKGGAVDAKWEIIGEHAQGLGSGLSVSMLDQKSGGTEGADPFADDEASSGLMAVWKGVQGMKKLVSGNYVAK